jgi:hypothetical protein
MATGAKTGWGGEFHLDSASNVLTELTEVVSFTLPNGVTEMLDASHMKSPNRRREFIAGMIDDGEIQIVLNYIAGGATDLLIQAAKNDGVLRDFMAVVPRATANWEIAGTGVVTGWDRGEIVSDAPMRGTMTIKVSGDQDEAAAS